MNIIEHAMNMEIEEEKYYRDMAENCADKGLATILTMLADDQADHYQILKKLQNKHKTDFAQSEILTHAKNVFAELNARDRTCEMYESQVQPYQKARELEKKSLDFYLEKAELAQDTQTRELLLRLADEEKKHLHLLDNMIEYMNRPQTWLENAEFNQLEAY